MKEIVTMGGSDIASNKWSTRRNSLSGDVRDEGITSRSWSVAERAELVTSSCALSSLLEAEVRKSGVFTAGGHKAIYRQFLYSDTVEEELKKSFTTISSAPSKIPVARRSFGDLIMFIQGHREDSEEVSMDCIASIGFDHHTSCTSSSDRNLAPRRPSTCSQISLYSAETRSLGEVEMENLQDHDVNHWDALFTEVNRNSSSTKDDETSERHRMKMKAHLVLREVNLDPHETIVKTKSNYEKARQPDDTSSLDSVLSGSADEEECGWLPWPNEEQTDNGWLPWPKEHTDNGWLPWPKEQTIDVDDEGHGEEYGWLPWSREEVDN